MLPMILTSNLAKGAVKMAKKKTIVKKLDAIQNFGATYLGFQVLPLSYYPWLIGILLCYCSLTQVVKKLYIKKYGEWL